MSYPAAIVIVEMKVMDKDNSNKREGMPHWKSVLHGADFVDWELLAERYPQFRDEIMNFAEKRGKACKKNQE